MTCVDCEVSSVRSTADVRRPRWIEFDLQPLLSQVYKRWRFLNIFIIVSLTPSTISTMKSFFLVTLLLGVASAQFGFFRRSPQNRFNNFIRQGGNVAVDDRLGNSQYHFSWRHAGFNTKWEWGGAVAYCRSLGRGWEPISINSREENNLAVRAIGRERVQYIWTGGHIANGGWRWFRGPFVNLNLWSRTGGFRRPQPDNREGNESCLSILNNVYPNDGITWHDVGCHHRKPTICELSF